MKAKKPINIIIHAPKSPGGIAELERRVAAVHSDAVIRRIKMLPNQADQKKLLDALIADAAAREPER